MGENKWNLYEKLLKVSAKVRNPYALAAVCATLVIILSLGAVSIFVYVENITVSIVVAVFLIVAMICVLIIGLGALRIILSPKPRPPTTEPTTIEPPRTPGIPTRSVANSSRDLPHDLRVDADISTKIKKPLKKLGFKVEFDRIKKTFWGNYWYSYAEKGALKIGMVSLPKEFFSQDNEELWALRHWYRRIIGVMERGVTHIAVFSPCSSICDTANLEADNIMNFDRIDVAVFMKRHLDQISQLDDDMIAQIIKVRLHLPDIAS